MQTRSSASSARPTASILESLTPSHPITPVPQPSDARIPAPHRVDTLRNEWYNPLFTNLTDSGECIGAAVCPCLWIYGSADILLSENGSSISRFSRSESTCYASLLSLMVCAPALFCVDRTATHALNQTMDRHEMHSEDDEEEGFSEAMYALLAATGFGTRRAERRNPASWTHDGKGFDLHQNESEDWWAANWCCYYTRHTFCCDFLRCRFANSARQTTPMCFALLCGGIYPLCLCPSTFVLRRVVVDSRNLSESCCDSMLRALLCTPCSLVQISREIKHVAPRKALLAKPNTTNQLQ